jgi:hypothetical protein
MPTQRYTVSQQSIDSLFTFIKNRDIAIPEIQRPFVWDAVKVRNFLDSLYLGYPVGFLIAWKNPNVRLKDGRTSEGKRILIDGQQRVTALMASLLGMEVINKDYKKGRIRISYHPIRRQFEVANPAIAKDSSWIYDVATVFDPNTDLLDLVTAYCEKNLGCTQGDILKSVLALQKITSNQIGLIDLNSDLDIETVTEIFIRVNSAGVPLSQADFAMSKIAVDEKHGGNTLRKAIDYFCHMSKAPNFFETVQNDAAFSSAPYLNQMKWLKDESGDLYDPSYTDMLRVVFASEFKRGRLEDMVALISGRNFETEQYEESIVEDSFNRLRNGISRYINENHFKSFIMILHSAGFVDSSMIGSQNAINFAYALFLTLRAQGMQFGSIQQHVRRWFAMSSLTGRYSSSPESAIDLDIRQASSQDFDQYAQRVMAGIFSDAYWEVTLPQQLSGSSSTSPAFRVFLAAQVKLGDMGFLSQGISVKSLIEYKSDVHHVCPRDFLKKNGLDRSQYNRVANYVVAESTVNIQIGNKEPRTYFGQLHDQVNGGPKAYGNITDRNEMRENFRQNCIPEGMLDMGIDEYPAFLIERQQLMAQKIRAYFESL